jgi:hypothetical protein
MILFVKVLNSVARVLPNQFIVEQFESQVRERWSETFLWNDCLCLCHFLIKNDAVRQAVLELVTEHIDIFGGDKMKTFLSWYFLSSRFARSNESAKQTLMLLEFTVLMSHLMIPVELDEDWGWGFIAYMRESSYPHYEMTNEGRYTIAYSRHVSLKHVSDGTVWQKKLALEMVHRESLYMSDCVMGPPFNRIAREVRRMRERNMLLLYTTQ